MACGNIELFAFGAEADTRPVWPKKITEIPSLNMARRASDLRRDRRLMPAESGPFSRRKIRLPSPECEVAHSPGGRVRLCCLLSNSSYIQVAHMKQFHEKANASAGDRFCPNLPGSIVSALLHGHPLRIIRPLPSAIKFVL